MTEAKNSHSFSRLTSVEKWVPGLRAVRTYQPAWLPRDVVAGIVLCTLLVPQGMAYAELAGLPPITGLYTTVVCLVAYAVVGPSPVLVLGPDSSLGPMIAAAILPLAADNMSEAVVLASMLAILVGLINVGAGIGKLGFVADLLSKPVRVGYLAGLAVTIFIGQLPKLFGFSTDADGFIDKLVAFFTQLQQTNGWALGVGLLCLLIIVGLRTVRPKWPGILLAVATAIGLSIAFGMAERNVAVIGVLPQGFPIASFPGVPFSDLPMLFIAALGMSLVAVGDTISTSAGFAARQGYEVDSNQELVGIGAANLLAGLFSGFPISTSSSRTAVAEQSGAKTQLTGLVAAASVLAMLVFLPGLVKDMPQPVLAAVIIAASISLFDYRELRHLWSVRKSECFLAIACILGVVFVGILEGIIIAVVLSILQFFERAWRPHSAVLGQADSIHGFQDIQRYPEAKQLEGMIMLRWDAPLFFANANLFRQLIRDLLKQAEKKPLWVLVTAEPVTDIDTTAAEMLADLDLELNADGIHLVFAELKGPVQDKMVRYGLLETIDHRHFCPTIEIAVTSFYQEMRAHRHSSRVTQ